MHSEPVQIYIDVCRSLWRDAGMLGCLLKVDIQASSNESAISMFVKGIGYIGSHIVSL